MYFFVNNELKDVPFLKNTTPSNFFIILTLLQLIFGIILYLIVTMLSNKQFYYIAFTILIMTSLFILHSNFIRNSSEIANNANFIYTNKMIKENLKADDLKILYFNDKYIFYNIIYESNHQIYIYKLENIFY